MRLFFVNTEYHLFVSLVLIEKWSLLRSEYLIIIIKSKNRFNDCYLENKPFLMINNELNIILKKYSIFDLEPYLSNQYAEAYFFLDTEYINCYYIKYLKNAGCKITLIQDGMNAYWKIINISYLKKLFKNYSHYFYLHYFKGLKYLYFNISWGASKIIDEVLVTNPELLGEMSKIRKLELGGSDFYFSSAFEVFNIRLQKIYNRQVLYISQGFNSHKQKEIEKHHIKQLAELLLSVNKVLLVKVHPSIPKEEYKCFANLSNVELILKSYPVELLISRMKNSLIISPFSAANLFYIHTNKYFWTYPLFYKKWNQKPAPKHIHIVDELKDLLFEINILFFKADNRRSI